MKNITEVEKKIFIERKDSSTIKKNYNHLEVNCKLIYGKGADCINMKNKELNRIKMDISSKYKIKEKVVDVFFKKCEEEGYSVEKSKKIIIDFLEKDNLSKTCPLI